MPPGMGMSGLPMVQMGMGGMKARLRGFQEASTSKEVKNTFLDYDTDGTPLGNRWVNSIAMHSVAWFVRHSCLLRGFGLFAQLLGVWMHWQMKRNPW